MMLVRVEYEFFDFEEPSSTASGFARQIRLHFSDAPTVYVSWSWERQRGPDSANLTHLAEVLIIQVGLLRHSQFHPANRANSENVGFPHYQLGLIARARREYPDALKHFERAIRCYSPFPLARVARRDVREAMKVVGRTP